MADLPEPNEERRLFLVEEFFLHQQRRTLRVVLARDRKEVHALWVRDRDEHFKGYRILRDSPLKGWCAGVFAQLSVDNETTVEL